MISIIICSIDKGKFAQVCRNYTDLLDGEEFEIIGIHDAKSLCEGYNRGVRKSSGSILVFSHDDIEILSKNFAETLKHHLSSFDLVGVAGTSLLLDGEWVLAGRPYIYGQVAHYIRQTGKYAVWVFNNSQRVFGGIQAMDGLFFAVNREVTERIQFDETAFDGFHMYDLDFTLSAYLAGFKTAVCNDIPIIHQSVGSHDQAWIRYRDKFRAKHASILTRNHKVNRLFESVLVDDKNGVSEYFNKYKRKLPL